MIEEEKTLAVQEKQLDLQMKQAENFNKLIEKGIPLIERYITARIEKIEAPKFKWTMIIFSLLLFVVIIGTGFLVYQGKVSSDNFTFLVGILIGSVITFLGDIISEAKQ